METLIIHISGASGSGKTTLGNKLKEHFKSKIIVKDLDELLDEHFVDYFGFSSAGMCEGRPRLFLLQGYYAL